MTKPPATRERAAGGGFIPKLQRKIKSPNLNHRIKVTELMRIY